jgi:hypothetical protein
MQLACGVITLQSICIYGVISTATSLHVIQELHYFSCWSWSFIRINEVLNLAVNELRHCKEDNHFAFLEQQPNSEPNQNDKG